PAIWIPLRSSAEDSERRFGRLNVIGRLRPQVSIRVAEAEMTGLSARLAAAYPDSNGRRTLQVRLVLDEVVGDMKHTLWIFFGAVACVLLIGIVNLTNLQIIRNSARERDFAVRAALGAGRGRLIRQLVVETMLLSSVGGVIGLLVSIAGTHILL